MTVDERGFFVSGGTLPLESKSYIERSADRDLLAHLVAGNYCCVLNARQMGKSSLSVRATAKLEERGIRTVFIDLTRIGGQNIQATQWYAGLAGEVGDALDLSDEALVYYQQRSDLSPMQRFFKVVEDVLLAAVEDPIVIFIDEIDATRNLPFDTDEFFAGIRECHNRRVKDEAFRRLTFCLIGVAVPKDLIRNPVTTPFNVGERIAIGDFTLEEVKGFASALGPNGVRLAERVHYWTDGQPFLTQSLCKEIVSIGIEDEAGVDKLVDRLFFDPRAVETNLNLADVANRALNDGEPGGPPESLRAELLSTYERALRGAAVKDDEANRVAVVLKLSGLMRTDGTTLVPRNRIYVRVFDRAWVRSHMPGQELVRQRQSFQRGLLRGAVLAAAVGIVIGAFAVIAFRSRAEALTAERKLDYDLYVSDMYAMRLLEETGNRTRMSEILDKWRTSDHRNFEWRFWMARLHNAPEEYTLDYDSPGKTEKGYVSVDGRQLCIQDSVTNRTYVLDRATKRMVGSQGSLRPYVTATHLGIVEFDHWQCPAQVMDVASGKVLGDVGEPGKVMEDSGLRPQSDYVLINQSNPRNRFVRSVGIWNLVTGKEVFARVLTAGLSGESISRDGQRFACLDPNQSSGDRPADLVVWSAATNTRLDTVPNSASSRFRCLSPTGRYIAYIDSQNVLILRDVDRHRVVFSVPSAEDSIPTSVEISADEHTMASITSDGVAALREIPSGRRLSLLANVSSLAAIGEHSEWIASSSSVRVLSLAGAEQGIIARAQAVHTDGFGAFRLTAYMGSIPRVSDPGLKPLTPYTLPAAAHDLTYNGDWALIDLPGRTSAVISVSNALPPLRFPMHVGNFSCGTSGDPIVVMDNDRRFYGYTRTSDKPLWSTTFDPNFRSAWVSPDRRSMIGCSDDGRIASVDPLTGRIRCWGMGHRISISCIAFSADGRFIATGDALGGAVLREAETLRIVTELRGSGGHEATGLAISPDDKRLATCNTAGSWQVWDASTGAELTEIKASGLPLTSVVFTSDGRTLVTAGVDGWVRAWGGLDGDPTVRIPLSPEVRKALGDRGIPLSP